MKKISIVIISIMLTTSCINVFFHVETVKASGNTIFVGGDGPGNYTSIQNAINASSSGDTIYVYSGTYYETIKNNSYVYIDKSINLIGENKQTTIIDCIINDDNYTGIGLYWGLDNVKISGFTVKGYNQIGIGIYVQQYDSYNITIENCIVHDFSDGISVYGAHNCIIRNCIIYNNDRDGGITIPEGDNHEIYNCYSYSNSFGIDLQDADNCEIYNNIFFDNNQGVRINYTAFNNSFYHNDLMNNIQNAFDEGSNYWDNGYPSGGNYWDDYSGTDEDGDGIGDTPYNISGGSNQDLYPFIEENGWINQPPNTPNYFHPNNHQTEVNVNDSLVWTCSDPDGDNLTFDVYFGTSSNPPLVYEDMNITHYFPDDMNYNTTYYWKIVAEDEHGAKTEGPVWDFTTISEPNNPPYQPSNPNPIHNEINVDINTNLSWTGGDPDPDDIVTYDVYFGNDSTIQKIASNISNTSINPGILAKGITYIWSIIAWDNHGASTGAGTEWSFTTVENTTNKPPNKPDKPTGSTSGKIRTSYAYSTSTTDPDNDNVYYMFDWGDETNSGWEGPYNSGDNITIAHIWLTQGNFPIKVKAKDIYGHETVWSDPLVVTMPKSYIYNPIIQILLRIFQHFPLFEKILNQILV
jgi:parallel beta-helix repeat protein